MAEGAVQGKRGLDPLGRLATVGDKSAPIVKEMLVVKNLAQGLLGVVWFVQSIPHVVKLFTAEAIAGLKWISFLKPFEKCLVAIKHMGNFLELPERLVGLRKVAGEWLKGPNQNRWKAVYRLTSLFYIALDALVIIPAKYGVWNLLAIGGWAARVGVSLFGLGVVRDAFTVGSSAINVVAEGKNRARAQAMIVTCHKKNEALKDVKEILEKKIPLSPEQLQKINDFKTKFIATNFGNQKQDKVKAEKEANDGLKKAEAAKTKLIEEKAKFIAEFKGPAALKRITLAKKYDDEIAKQEKIIGTKKEKLERIKVSKETVTADNIDRYRQVVVYKATKNEVVAANKEMAVQKATVTRWYDIFKCAVVIFVNLTALGAATFLAPPLGLSVAAVATVFFIGQWITGLSCGLAGLGKVAAMYRYKDDVLLPRTNLVRA